MMAGSAAGAAAAAATCPAYGSCEPFFFERSERTPILVSFELIIGVDWFELDFFIKVRNPLSRCLILRLGISRVDLSHTSHRHIDPRSHNRKCHFSLSLLMPAPSPHPTPCGRHPAVA